MSKVEFLENVKLLIQMHSVGHLGGEVMPEDVLLGIVPDEELMNVLTLGMSLNYQRNSYALWQSIVQAYTDVNSRWVFNPSAVCRGSIDDLRTALINHRVALQPNRHPEIWKKVAKGIAESSLRGDVFGLIDSVQFDIAALKEIMQIKRKSEFPYLSGPKIFNYWLYVLESYTAVKWKYRNLITVAPDTHILQATVKLGLCSPEVLNGSAEDRQTVAEAWEKALSGSGLSPIDVHTPLWLWSRAGFPVLSTNVSPLTGKDSFIRSRARPTQP
ncbi:hypothetical protein RAC89_25410 [Paenibacillus sp. GD4]|uniref:hypothetical protein n=1 Tax=Paenibacillus sp. GD4 TaxID=3068890 RepID=UPI00279690C5|nr:hypothetical protein [Paenibacillus sp. GD4]MDQ1913744.1 hypothetical protein [Paenibacillus sp. GD4]